MRGSRVRSAFDFAYVEFGGEDGPPWAGLRWFLTQTARGLAQVKDATVHFFSRFVVACTFDGENTFAGSYAQDVWPGGDAEWDVDAWAFVEHATPTSTSTCPGSPNLFSELEEAPTAEYLSATHARATHRAFNDGYGGHAFEPRADSYLLNELSTADWLALGISLAPDSAWGSTVDGVPSGRTIESIFTAPEASYTWALAVERARWYFRPPASGTGLRVKFTVYWEEEGISAVVYDSVVLEWDREIPVGYDAADDTTWPRTAWYELPVPPGPGRFYIGAVTIECGPTSSPSEPGDVTAANV